MPRARAIGVALLALQLAWFAREQLGSSRYFCWAPLHEQVFYRIEARVGGARLSDAEVAARYGRRGALYVASRRAFWELNAAQHVLDSVVLRERALPREQRAQVSVRYQVNGRQEQVWTYAP